MANPRVFVSSTYYDLKYIRASLESFIENYGFDAALHERGGVAYSHKNPLDESAYAEIKNDVDILILIIGGRYGSMASGERSQKYHQRLQSYNSVVKREYQTAVGKNIPIYTFIDASVFAEFQTWRKNIDNKGRPNWHHVDSPAIFELIDNIVSKRRNNLYREFSSFADIESWLRIQWAGHFKRLLSDEQQSLSFETMAEEIETIKKYLEHDADQDKRKTSYQQIAKSVKEKYKSRHAGRNSGFHGLENKQPFHIGIEISRDSTVLTLVDVDSIDFGRMEDVVLGSMVVPTPTSGGKASNDSEFYDALRDQIELLLKTNIDIVHQRELSGIAMSLAGPVQNNVPQQQPGGLALRECKSMAPNFAKSLLGVLDERRELLTEKRGAGDEGENEQRLYPHMKKFLNEAIRDLLQRDPNSFIRLDNDGRAGARFFLYRGSTAITNDELGVAHSDKNMLVIFLGGRPDFPKG